MKSRILLFVGILCASHFLLSVTALADSPVQVSTGYYDLAPPIAGNTAALPDPWYGSVNTTFYGSASLAQSGDPDEDAILLQNLGSTPVTLSAADFGGTQNLFTLDSISGSITLNPNQNYILAGVDGSDASFTDQVNLTIGGNNYSYNDAVNSVNYPDGVLHGFPTASDETVSWTPIYTPTFSTPDNSSTLLLAACSIITLGCYQLRLRRVTAVS